jgi:ferredoxin
LPLGRARIAAIPVTDILERKVGAVTVRIDRTTCIGTANCVKVAPELFVLDDVGIIAFREAPADVEPELALEACRVCPVDALAVFDSDGHTLV